MLVMLIWGLALGLAGGYILGDCAGWERAWRERRERAMGYRRGG